jgi:hypothetical protein
MQVGMFTDGRSATVKLLLDDVEQAAFLSGHIAEGAPDGVAVSQDGNTVTVLRMFETEEGAEDWAQELREGMHEGYLFNLKISGVRETPRH